MHASVMDFVHAAIDEDDIVNRRVLELGSYNVNGSVRPYIESLSPAQYLGVDKRPGPLVDRVADCEQSIKDFGTEWDVVISTEMLEHVFDWRAAMVNMTEALKPNGLLLLTTRGPGFPLHSYPEDHWRFTVDDMELICDALWLSPLVLRSDPEAPGVFLLARTAVHVPQPINMVLDHIEVASMAGV